MPARPLSHAEYRTRSYAPELDGLRAIAVLLVITCHVQGQAFVALAGFLGVSVFFVLSGYLITTLALREEAKTGHLNLPAFYVRRTCRIFPLFYLVLGLYAVALLVLNLRPIQGEFLTEHWWQYVFYFQEWAYAEAGHSYQSMPFTQSWSLGIEEKFYLVWPALAFLLLAARPRWRSPAAWLLLIAVSATPWCLQPAGFSQLTHCLVPYGQILAGCVLALCLNNPTGCHSFLRIRRRVGGAGLVGTWVVAHLATPVFGEAGYGAVWSLAYLFTATMMVGEVVAADGWVQRALRWRPLVEIGKLSYGIYLIHFLPLMAAHAIATRLPWTGATRFVDFALTAAGSIGIAWILALTVERPFIRLGRTWSGRMMQSERQTVCKLDRREAPASCDRIGTPA
jgi:peptidoglycan/LPS O-acetylase OafA/YrhL